MPFAFGNIQSLGLLELLKSFNLLLGGRHGIYSEIGKKDIVDRNSLSVEPFDRNCSFVAMDFSYTNDISDPLIER
jgi:hypothetical protein